MTSSITPPPEGPPQGSATAFAHDHSQPEFPSSKAEVAKSEAADASADMADTAKDVAGVAKEQVSAVTAEAATQVKHLVDQARTEIGDQAQTQQTRLASGLQSLGDQLQAMAAGSDQPGVATDLAHQAADKARQVGQWLEDRDPGSVLQEVKTFARQRPGAFLALALGAGVVTGRLVRGIQADPDDSSGNDTTASNPLPREAASLPVQQRSALTDPTSEMLSGRRDRVESTFEPDLPPPVRAPLGGSGQFPGFEVPPTAGSQRRPPTTSNPAPTTPRKQSRTVKREGLDNCLPRFAQRLAAQTPAARSETQKWLILARSARPAPAADVSAASRQPTPPAVVLPQPTPRSRAR